MIEIKVAVGGDTKFETIYKKVVEIQKELDADFTNAIAETGGLIKHYISTSKKRRTGKSTLEDAIEAKKILKGDEIVYGIGEINKLNQVAPYWFVLNYGRKWTGGEFIPPTNLGYFVEEPHKPQGGTDERSEWIHTGNRKDFLLKPQKFTPINYIEYGVRYLINKIEEILTKLKSKIS